MAKDIDEEPKLTRKPKYKTSPQYMWWKRKAPPRAFSTCGSPPPGVRINKAIKNL